jgi:hypothetical protein
MNIFGIEIIEHPSLEKDEAWIIFKRDSPQVPDDLRDALPIPCILTGDMTQTKRMLTLLQAIAVPHTSDLSRQPRTVLALLDDSHPLASLQRALYQ